MILLVHPFFTVAAGPFILVIALYLVFVATVPLVFVILICAARCRGVMSEFAWFCKNFCTRALLASPSLPPMVSPLPCLQPDRGASFRRVNEGRTWVFDPFERP